MSLVRIFCLAFFTLLSLLTTFACAYGDQRPDPSMSTRIALDIQALTRQFSPAAMRIGSQTLKLHDDLANFYIKRDFQPAWFNPIAGRVSAQARSLHSVVRDAAEHGLHPEDYHFEPIRQLLELVEDYRRYGLAADPFRLAQLDLLLSDAFLSYASHLTAGRVDPNLVHAGQWRARPRQADIQRLLNFSLENGRVAETLLGMVPAYAEYRRLREALLRYRLIAAIGGWPSLPPGSVLRPDDKDQRLPLLRKRLWIEGDLSYMGEEGDLQFDGRTARALGKFQARHGLLEDRVLGPKTLRELNRTVEQRIRQIEINLERWRWLPKDLGDNHIRVNIADFKLQVVEGGRTVMSMPVVVGTSYRETPVFSGRMTYLEFAPYWGVPQTILEEDKLPEIRGNVSYLDEHNFEIIPWSGPAWARIDPRDIDWDRVTAENFPGLLRMRPGPWNPLGQVKFMFPNEFDVYLHDTPERHLFARDRRLYSSGCIRIERPLDLAQYLLEDDAEWGDCMALLELIHGAEPRRVQLEEPLPVHLLYWTAWVDASGSVQFRPDVYERDGDLMRALVSHRQSRRNAVKASESVAQVAGQGGSDQILEPVKGEEGSGG